MDKKTVKKNDPTGEASTVIENRKSKPLKVRKGEIIDGAPSLIFEDDPAATLDTFASTDRGLLTHFTAQLVRIFAGVVTPEGIFDERKLLSACNNGLAILHGVNPKDEIEAMLATQMIGCHNVAMTLLERSLASCVSSERQKEAVNQATKMMRTYAAQMEAIKKYRTGGQQTMKVEHVHVNQGGQAVIGNVAREGGGNEKKEG